MPSAKPRARTSNSWAEPYCPASIYPSASRISCCQETTADVSTCEGIRSVDAIAMSTVAVIQMVPKVEAPLRMVEG
jgi:hypothetical protein